MMLLAQRFMGHAKIVETIGFLPRIIRSGGVSVVSILRKTLIGFVLVVTGRGIRRAIR